MLAEYGLELLTHARETLDRTGSFPPTAWLIRDDELIFEIWWLEGSKRSIYQTDVPRLLGALVARLGGSSVLTCRQRSRGRPQLVLTLITRDEIVTLIHGELVKLAAESEFAEHVREGAVQRTSETGEQIARRLIAACSGVIWMHSEQHVLRSQAFVG